MTSTPYLYDQVKLTDSTQGVVLYIGEVQGKNGTMFGLEMLPYYGGHDTADTTGTIGDQTYFKTSDDEPTGRFVTDDDIDDIIDQPTHDLKLIGEAPEFTVGDRCYIAKKNCNAMVHYVGIPNFSRARGAKIFIGLELDEPVGNCNGTLANCTYFECEDKYGVYQVPNNVALAQQEINVDIDEVDQQNYEQDEKENEEAERLRREEQEEEERRERERQLLEEQEAQNRLREEQEAQRRARETQERAKDQQERERRIKEAKERERRRSDELHRQRRLQEEEERQRREKAQAERERQRKLREEKERQERAAREAAQKNDDYKAAAPVYGDLAAPKLSPRTVVDGDTETIYPTYMTNFCVKARTHHKLKNFKTINYSSRKFQVNDQAVQEKLEELAKNHVADRGHFILDGDKRFVYTLVNKPHEWRAAVRVNTDDISEAKQCLTFIEQNTQNAVADVDRIQKFNWDRNFQSLVSAIRKANM